MDAVIALLISTFITQAFFWTMKWFQDEDPRFARIIQEETLVPGTKQIFLTITGFATMTWGDLIGVNLVWASYLLQQWQLGWSFSWWALTISVTITSLFHWLCLGPNHKPDTGYPEAGVVSIHGRIHLGLMGLSYFVGISAFQRYIHLINQNFNLTESWATLFLLTGIFVWVAAAIRDFMTKRFDPIRREPIGRDDLLIPNELRYKIGPPE